MDVHDMTIQFVTTATGGMLPDCFSREVGWGGNTVVEPTSVACFVLCASTVRGRPHVEFISVWIIRLALFNPVKIPWGHRKVLLRIVVPSIPPDHTKFSYSTNIL